MATIPIEHYTKTMAICNEIADLKRQKVSEFKKMTKEEKQEYKAFRQRFKNDFHNPTLVEQRLVAWANDRFEPVNLRDNSVIQREWRATYLAPDDVPISYE
jgi:hypothetical protein